MTIAVDHECEVKSKSINQGERGGNLTISEKV